MSEMAYGERILSRLPMGNLIAVDAIWYPSPEEVEKAFLQLAGYLDHMAIPMVASQFIAMKDTEERFETETDPEGTRWAPLDPDYLASKVGAGYPEDILHREGTLEDVAPLGWRIMGDSLMYDTTGLPEYGRFHQTGTGLFEAAETGGTFRSAARIHRDRVRGIEKTGTKYIDAHANMNVGRGMALPPRPFIGLSEAAMDEIALVFETWMDAGIESMPLPPAPRAPSPPSGFTVTSLGHGETRTAIPAFGGGTMVRGAGGRFTRRVF
jgi:hypothetical protein